MRVSRGVRLGVRQGCAACCARVCAGKCVVSSGARGGQGWTVVQDAKSSGGAGKNGKSGAAAGAAADDADETDDQGCALPLCPPPAWCSRSCCGTHRTAWDGSVGTAITAHCSCYLSIMDSVIKPCMVCHAPVPGLRSDLRNEYARSRWPTVLCVRLWVVLRGSGCEGGVSVQDAPVPAHPGAPGTRRRRRHGVRRGQVDGGG